MTELKCVKCSRTYAGAEILFQCDACSGRLEYVVDPAGGGEVDASRSDMWRYADLLPLASRKAIVSLGAGWSPIVELEETRAALGGARLFVKLDAVKHPTGTFKDREASLVISRCKARGLDNLVFYSTCNTGRAYMHYAATAGLSTFLLMPTQCQYKLTRPLTRGPRNFVLAVDDDYPRIGPYAKQFAAANGLCAVAPLHDRTEAYTTLAYEQVEQMPDCDFFAQTIASGMGPIGFLRGHRHLAALGRGVRVPRIVCIQSSETNAMFRAYRAGKREMTSADLPATFPDSLFEPTLNSTNPVNNYPELRDCLDASQGLITDVEPSFVKREMPTLVAALEHRGVRMRFDLEQSVLIGYAGLVRLAAEGHFSRDNRILLLATGRGDATASERVPPDLVIRPSIDDPRDVLRRLTSGQATLPAGTLRDVPA